MQDGLSWLREWEASRGRPLRVLHIGNIANNAYINAKLQRRIGIEADVVCYDYYHVMGTPEWEDSEFEGDVGDDAFPDWRRVDLHGFRRPRWFVQGRLGTCRRYLLAMRTGDTRTAAVLRARLAAERWLACRSTRTAAAARRALSVLRRVRRGARLGSAVAARLLRGGGRRLRRARKTGPDTGLLDPPLPAAADESDSVVSDLARRYLHHFPDRSPFDPETARAYLADAGAWRPVLDRYDIVQAYALDPAIPFVAGAPYAAYEHGTLRKTPFEESPVGQLCALTYRDADVVFVTNIDDLDAARRLGIDDSRIVALPHAVDSERLHSFTTAHGEVHPEDDLVRIFSPSRQDWVDRDPNWTKGNDRLIRAFRRVVDDHGTCRLTLVEWGRDLDATRRLINELGLDAHVDWLPTMRKQALWFEYLRSHAVADQFVLPAFGSVTFEALALGRRVITSLDGPAAEEFFGEAPPLLVASSEDEIESALREVAADPSDAGGRGSRCADWFFTYHSSDRILRLELGAYRRILDGERRPRISAAADRR